MRQTIVASSNPNGTWQAELDFVVAGFAEEGELGMLGDSTEPLPPTSAVGKEPTASKKFLKYTDCSTGFIKLESTPYCYG